MGGHDGRFSRDSLPVFLFFFSAGCLCEQFWHGHRYPFFDADHPAFPLQTTASPTFQNALNDSFHQAVVACDVPEPCKFPSLDSSQKGFLWTHREVDLAPHPVVCLVLQVGDTEKCPHALGFESVDPFLFSPSFFFLQQAVSMFHSRRGGWK